jgi:hypothetical protein
LNSDRFFQSDGKNPIPAGANAMKFGVGQLDPTGLSLLDKLVDATGAKIVISSSWRHIWSWHEIAEMFGDAGFKNQHAIIDQTGTSPSDHRGTEIKEWLALDQERQVVGVEQTTSYVIIDDTPDFDTEQMQYFVMTNPQTGIKPRDVQKAISILSRA